MDDAVDRVNIVKVAGLAAHVGLDGKLGVAAAPDGHQVAAVLHHAEHGEKTFGLLRPALAAQSFVPAVEVGIIGRLQRFAVVEADLCAAAVRDEQPALASGRSRAEIGEHLQRFDGIFRRIADALDRHLHAQRVAGEGIAERDVVLHRCAFLILAGGKILYALGLVITGGEESLLKLGKLIALHIAACHAGQRIDRVLLELRQQRQELVALALAHGFEVVVKIALFHERLLRWLHRG